MFCCKTLDRSRGSSQQVVVCVVPMVQAVLLGVSFNGGGRCSFGVAVWRFYNGRRSFGTGLGFFTCRTLLFGCQSLVMGMSNGLIIEVCFLGW